MILSNICLRFASCRFHRSIRFTFITYNLNLGRQKLSPIAIGSLRNHDDDGNKNPRNLHIWQWKTVFLHALHVHFVFWHFKDVLVLSKTWNDLFCCCVDDVCIRWQMFNFVFLCPKGWFQFNSRMVRAHFSSIMTLNNWKMIAETRSYILQMKFSLPWTSCLLKLPNNGRGGRCDRWALTPAWLPIEGDDLLDDNPSTDQPRPTGFNRELSYSNLSSLLGIKRQLEKLASQ